MVDVFNSHAVSRMKLNRTMLLWVATKGAGMKVATGGQLVHSNCIRDGPDLHNDSLIVNLPFTQIVLLVALENLPLNLGPHFWGLSIHVSRFKFNGERHHGS